MAIVVFMVVKVAMTQIFPMDAIAPLWVVRLYRAFSFVRSFKNLPMAGNRTAKTQAQTYEDRTLDVLVVSIFFTHRRLIGASLTLETQQES